MSGGGALPRLRPSVSGPAARAALTEEFPERSGRQRATYIWGSRRTLLGAEKEAARDVPRASRSQVDLLRDGECVVDLDTEVANCALQLAGAKP